MVLKKQENERTITESKAEYLTLPSTTPYQLLLEEVPDSVSGVLVRRVGPVTKNGTGSGTMAASGHYAGTTTKHFKVVIDTAGDVGAATFKWSDTNGVTWNGTLIPISDTSDITLLLNVAVAFAVGAGQDFNLNDEFTFDAEVWTPVTYVPNASFQYQVNYVNGKVTFYPGDAGKIVWVDYEGRGSLADASDVNDLIDVLNQGEVCLRLTNTNGFSARQVVAVLSVNSYQLANATDQTKPAVGFVKEVSATQGEVILFGPLDGFTGLTTGAQYYLDTTDGAITTSAPSGQGQIKQKVGRALSTTRLMVRISDDFTVNP